MMTKNLILVAAFSLGGCGAKKDSGTTATDLTKTENPGTDEEKDSTVTDETVLPADDKPDERLRLDLTGAVGLGVKEKAAGLNLLAAGGESSLVKLNSDGSTVNALVGDNQPVIKNIFTAPATGKIFLVFDQPIPMYVFFGATLTDERCILASADKETGEISCVDSTLVEVSWDNQRPIQFDTAGGIYFMGRADDHSQVGTINNNLQVIRKVADSGVKSSLASFGLGSNVQIADFTVQSNGDVLMQSGTWVRKVEITGGLKTVLDTSAQMYTLPNGNILLNRGSGTSTVYDAVSGILGTTPYISCSVASVSGYVCADPADTANWELDSNLQSADNFQHFVTTADQKVFGFGYQEGLKLVQLYPTVARHALTKIKTITNIVPAGNKLILVGTDTAGTHKLIEFDPATQTETDLLSEEIDVETLSYNGVSNVAIFSGLKFSTNSRVFGQIDLGTGLVDLKAVADKFSSFQSL
jgi:hypothetical protein